MVNASSRLKLPMTHLKYVEKLVRLHLRPMVLRTRSLRLAPALLFDAGPEVDDHEALPC
jgi:hypothetical protein